MATKKYFKDKKVDLYANVEGKDEEGFPTTEFKAVASGLWAYVRSLSRQEIYAADSNQTEDNILFVLNYRADVAALTSDSGYYIKFQDNFYQVLRVDPYEFYKDDLQVYCKFVGKKVS